MRSSAAPQLCGREVVLPLPSRCRGNRRPAPAKVWCSRRLPSAFIAEPPRTKSRVGILTPASEAVSAACAHWPNTNEQQASSAPPIACFLVQHVLEKAEHPIFGVVARGPWSTTGNEPDMPSALVKFRREKVVPPRDV